MSLSYIIDLSEFENLVEGVGRYLKSVLESWEVTFT